MDETAAGPTPELHLRRTEMLGSCAAVWADEEGLLAAERTGHPRQADLLLDTAPVAVADFRPVDQRDVIPAAHDADRAGDLVGLPPVSAAAPAIDKLALAAELANGDPPHRLHGATRFAVQCAAAIAAHARSSRARIRPNGETGAERDFIPLLTPDELWAGVFAEELDWRSGFGAVPFELAVGKWQRRYSQHNAINAVLEAIAKGGTRILLTLATGTGKTSIAFQSAGKLFHSGWNLTRQPGRRPRILFLADRNILADQAYNSLSAFEADALCRISPAEIRRRGGMPMNASVFFSIFQTLMTSGAGEEDESGAITNGPPNYLQYPAEFFDCIVIDECHRGGSQDESTWRGILQHFAPAVQLGLMATPKRKHNSDTSRYFGEPVYQYSLKEGIEDGFLTPFKVRHIISTIDRYVYDPKDEIVSGEIKEEREYDEVDFNRKIEIEAREKSRVAEFVGQIDQSHKTLVCCATQKHAARVRDYINQIKTRRDPGYCERVTADDGKIGEEHLRAFQDNEKSTPTILTTSQKLSTGVDPRNARNIVLMRAVKSMIEFKQIIGRDPRTFDGKDFFTIDDFVKAY